MEEIKIIYYIDDEDILYLIKLFIFVDWVMLGDFKNVLNWLNYKFFFKSVDDDFGWVFFMVCVLIILWILVVVIIIVVWLWILGIFVMFLGDVWFLW